MRLLQVNENGEFSLTKDIIKIRSHYAILSHTWGDDDDEVNFKDMMEGSGKTKAGYRKLQFCAEQASRDGLQYFWVDTCCIDKSNNNELSEAINSMFRWYRNAAKCYVYLSDVWTNDQVQVDPQSWESPFRKSRWFTRGWTLQELIAPPSVEFFCSNGMRLGDRGSLERQLHEITGIAVLALRGTLLSEFSVDERMSWAENRETKREEDKAYSLLGIFDIYMPLIYGEGEKSAFQRLQEEIEKSSRPRARHNPLDCLPFAEDAPFNSYSTQHAPTCLPHTRVDLLQEIYNWADGQDKRCIFWLNGLAGTGKSTIARTVARKYDDQKRLGASFFFSRGGGDVGHAGKFVTSIAVQLVSSIPTLHQHVCGAITERPNIASQSLRDQWHQLVLRPLSKLDGSGCQPSYILVVDALDECDDDNNIRIVLYLLAEARSLTRVRLRVFLTSRPEVPIRYGFYQLPETERYDVVLHNMSPSIVDNDISIFLEYSLRLIGEEDAQYAGWPGAEVIKTLVQSASGLFIWAATACRFIREGLFADERLHTLLKGSTSAAATPEEHLNGIYIAVLQNSVQPGFSQQDKEKFCSMLRDILGSIVLLLSPLSVSSLSRLLFIPKQRVDRILKDLHAILVVPNDNTSPLRPHHPSFRDFLLDENRCRDSNFWVEEKQVHQTLAESCIQLMSVSLKQDICGVNSPGQLATDIGSSRVDECLPLEVQYACLYWIEHLQKGCPQLQDNDQVHQFLQEHLLHWLEALGWMRKVSNGIHAITSLESVALSNDCPRLLNFVHDMKRFILYNRPAIEQAPLQTYCSALVFAPAMSVVRKQFEHCVPRWVRRLPKVENDWNALLQTLEGHSGYVSAVAFSPDGKQLASASDDRTVRLWDADSGAALHRLEGHSDYVKAVTFSPDGKHLASASRDCTVRLWDSGSGASLHTLEGRWGSVNAVAFSPNGEVLASASDDHTVRLWDVGSGSALHTLEGHWLSVSAVACSLTGKVLASASDDRTVRLWDSGTGTALYTLEGHSGYVKAVAFSPDGKLLASAPASSDCTIRLWDVSSGAALHTLDGHQLSVSAVAFSPDSKVLASASDDDTVRLWDSSSGAALYTLEGHWLSVSTVAFSPDGKVLASASDDRTVRLWDASSGAALQTLEGHWGSVRAVAFSPDGKQLASASASSDRTVRLWDAGSGAALYTLEGNSSSVSAVTFSPDGKLLASVPTSSDGTVRLWDTGSGAALYTLEGHSDYVKAVAFSSDSKLLASASNDGTVRLWDVSSGSALHTLGPHWLSVSAVAFSPDGKLLASVPTSSDGTVRLWNSGTGAALHTLKGHSGYVKAVAFSPDGKLLASAPASSDRTIRLWDVGSGAALHTFEGHSDYVSAVGFSPDGKLLASASDDGTVRLWDASSGAALYRLEGHSDYVKAVAFSPDGKLLASASWDTTVRLWDAGSGAALPTLKVDASIISLSFSDDGTFLQTDRGPIPIEFLSNSATLSRPNIPRSIFVKKQWVTQGRENILWLPSEHRPSDVAVYGSIVGFGYPSGRVTFMEFAL